jgi:hypothetical protein
MMQFHTNEQTDVAANAATHARSVLRQALAVASRGSVRTVFERAVTNEVANMLWLGVTPVLIAAFEIAAANVHQALDPDTGWPSGAFSYAT